jgi:hypothetical protein
VGFGSGLKYPAKERVVGWKVWAVWHRFSLERGSGVLSMNM